jgi:hypothetical protein
MIILRCTSTTKQTYRHFELLTRALAGQDYWKRAWVSVDNEGYVAYSAKKGHSKMLVGKLHDASYQALPLKGVTLSAFKLVFEDSEELILGSEGEEGRATIKAKLDMTRDRGCTLQLRGLGLLNMPVEVMRMVELVKLDISANQITSLPVCHSCHPSHCPLPTAHARLWH